LNSKELRGGEVSKVVSIPSNVKENGFGGEIRVLYFDRYIYLGFEVEVLDYSALGLLEKG
jgi:hypothetical protein